jgi:K+-transporting ATPase ATPase C chain
MEMTDLMGEVKSTVAVFVVLALLTGLIYPLAITGVVQTLMPEKAEGSLLRADGRIVGSELIGQMFTSPAYFHGRPSYVEYHANGSGGSNLGPSSARLAELARQNVDRVRRENDLPLNSSVPSDLVLYSGSGLDPDISVEAARLQVRRVAEARILKVSEVEKLVEENTQPSFFGILGQDRVNVCKLNLELDKLTNRYEGLSYG